MAKAVVLVVLRFFVVLTNVASIFRGVTAFSSLSLDAWISNCSKEVAIQE
jgi:hypothetical protein